VVNLYIGLMSGTSADSIDAAILDLPDNKINVLDVKNFPIPKELKARIYKASESDEIDNKEIQELNYEMGKLLVKSVKALLLKKKLQPSQIQAIGSHGQTIKHEPLTKNPFSLQIGSPEIISKELKITTVADFRSDDIQAGGQGAPITPVFHKAVFGSVNKRRVIINVGGISNLTAIDAKNKVIGFDTGPGNCLIDAWSRKNNIGQYDKNGNWARTGKVHEILLRELLKDKYFFKNYPKSTGPDYFNIKWLERSLSELNENIKPQDVQATLLELTTKSITDQVNNVGYQKENIYLCGGGIHNTTLVKSLSDKLQGKVKTTLDLGIDPDFLEAICFGWLAKKRIENVKFDLSSITGSNVDVYLGRIWRK